MSEQTGTRRRPAQAAAAPADQDPGRTRPAVMEWEPEVEMDASGRRVAEWNGVRTRFRAAGPMIRGDYDENGRALNPRLLGEGDPFEVLASKDPVTGRWVGPEAAHVEDLFRNGMILGSRQAGEIRAQINAIEVERGVYGTRDNPNGRPSLAQCTTERAAGHWGRHLAGGLKEMRRREGQESRADVAQDTVEQLVQGLGRLVAGDRVSGEWAGAQGPGTATTQGEG